MHEINGTWVNNPSASVVDILESGREYHAGMIQYASSLCKQHRIALDVGGCYGLTANQMADTFTEVHSFEPNPETYKCLVRNAKQNVICHNLGASSTEGKKTLHYTNNDGTARYVRPSNELIMYRRATYKQIDTYTVILDRFVGGNVDLIKFDIENHEEYALRGCLKIVARDKPIIIMERKSETPEYTHLALTLMGYEVDKIYRGKDYIYVHRNSVA